MEILLITGPPYSGKGTQCNLLRAGLGYQHVSTGDRIRKEKTDKTEIGSTMMAYEEKGDLVPDKIMQTLLAQIIDENKDAEGLILDGYPRTKSQADTLLNLLAEKGLGIKVVINIDVPKHELLARAKKRGQGSGRKDDQDSDTHIKRIHIFEAETRPAIDYMKSRCKVIDIDGLGTIEAITAKINEIITASH